MWFLTSKSFFWCLVLQYPVRTYVQNLYNCIACFCPKIHGKIKIKNHSSFGCLYDGPVLALNNSIFFRIVRCYQLPLDPYFLVKGIKILGGVLSSILRFECLNLLTYLIPHKSFKLLELTKDFILGIQKVNLSFPRGIINERNIINVTCQRS